MSGPESLSNLPEETRAPVWDLPAGRRTSAGLICGIALSAMMMGTLDSSVVSTALPTMHKTLHAPLSWLSWTITAYQFGLVMAYPVAGRISDQFGRKRIFLVCIVIFTVSSMACALAPNVYFLVVFRAIQALGAGAFAPSAIGFLTDNFGRNRDRAVGMTSSTVPVGALSGPVLGGIIVAYWSWRGIFLINVPIGVVLFILTVRYIPRYSPVAVARPDIKGVGLLAGAILPIMYAITAIGNGSALLSPQVCIPVGAGCVCIYLFIGHSRSERSPIIPFHFLFKGGFASLNIINFLYGGSSIGIGALIPLYAEDRYHFTSLQAGSVLSVRAAGVLTVGAASAFLVRRTGYRRPMILGFLVAAVGMVLVSLGPRGLSTYAWIAMGGAAMGIGAGISGPATNNAMLHNTPSEAGSISGLRQMFRQIGAISVVSVTSAVAARSHNEGLALAHSFAVLAVAITLIVVPLTFTVVDHRGSW